MAFELLKRLPIVSTWKQTRLSKLIRPKHPLLRQMQSRTPGTYHHSTIVVARLAEKAVLQIGADALLVRIGAYYHDIGKILRPYFFIKNQVDGVNVHDRLDPKTSAQIIISHITDGLELARKYRLPQAVRDFISQHHGTCLQVQFYNEAMRNSEEQPVDEESYRYPGPKPQGPETAIVMLADEVASVFRTRRPGSADQTAAELERIIDAVVAEGQLEESQLSQDDLREIRYAFAYSLRGMYSLEPMD